MTPYFEDKESGIVIYHGDCRDVLPGLGTVDLVLTDPPYNAGKDYGEFDDSQPWDAFLLFLEGVIRESERLSNGPVLVFQSVNGMKELCARYRPKHICVWNKPMSFSPRQGGSPFLPHWEPCLVYGTLYGEGGRVPPYHLPDVWNFNTAKRNGHPCPKPVELMVFLINSIPGDCILDPFLGSGTTLVAAKRLGRKAIGIEIEERYCEIAARRIMATPRPLFTEATPEPVQMDAFA